MNEQMEKFKSLGQLGQSPILSGANTLGVLGLSFFMYKSWKETNEQLEQMREEINILRNSLNENNKRSNIAFTRLNQKIEDSGRIIRNHGSYLENLKRNDNNSKITEVPDDIVEEEVDEISSALHQLMKR